MGTFEVQHVSYNRKHLPPMTFLSGKVTSGYVETHDWILLPGIPKAQRVWAIERFEGSLTEATEGQEVLLAIRGIIELKIEPPFRIYLSGKW